MECVCVCTVYVCSVCVCVCVCVMIVCSTVCVQQQRHDKAGGSHASCPPVESTLSPSFLPPPPPPS